MQGQIGVLAEPETVEIETYDVPEPDRGDLVIRIDLAGLDGTDVKGFEGKLPDSSLSQYPQVMSDEIVGTVESLGEGAGERYGVDVGDRVVVGPRITCGECEYCQGGNHAHCEKMMTYGRLDPREAPHFNGGCAEYLYVREGSNVYPVPEGLSDELALLSSVTLADGLRSAAIAGIEAGDSVVVVGPGPQGLACILGARARGASTIVAVGLPADESRLAFAERLGATDTVVSGEGDLADHVAAATDDRMADVAVECTGVPSVLESAIDLVRPGGVCHFVTMATGDATITPFDLVMEEVSLLPRRGPTPPYVRQALRSVDTWDGPVADIITETFPLSGIADACHTTGSEARAGETDVIKVAIDPQA